MALLLAHQGEWDGILPYLVPVVLLFVFLWRVQARAVDRVDDDDASAPD